MATIYTIGHSTRPIDEFIELLAAQEVTRLVDIRTVPKSRHNPQYWGDALEASLERAGIGYSYIKELGGLRPKRPDSPNTAWRNTSFRNYADHMLTEEFRAGLEQLLELAERDCCAIMCAEAVPWRCHRRLVADALVVRGHTALEIISSATPKEHQLTPFAVVDGTQVTYPATGEQEPEAAEG